LSPTVVAILSDHVVSGNVLFPGVGYMEIALSMGIVGASPRESSLTGVAFVRPCILPLCVVQGGSSESQSVVMRYARNVDRGNFDISSTVLSSSARGSFTTHAIGHHSTSSEVTLFDGDVRLLMMKNS
jgi:hypothetical protein